MSFKVLFVDDDESNLFVSEAVCGDEFDVLTADSGARALELMRANEVAVVLSDQRMPRMTGVELLEQVQKEFPDTVRLLVTAYADIQAAIDAINSGRVRRYLKKPWEPEELKAEIRDALEQYSMRRRLGELERRFVQAERVYALGIVAAGVGHELRNPIAWISSNLQHSLAELGDLAEELERLGQSSAGAKLEEVRAALVDANAGAERVVEIVSAMQSSIASPPNEPEIVDVEEVAKLALRMVEPELRRDGRVLFEVQGSGQGSGKVRATRTQITQVIVNLLVNAGHAVSALGPKHAVVAVRLATVEGRVVLSVADSGSGVPDAERDQIFEPFFTTKPGTGTGLGLAISRKIARELGGSLEVGRDPVLGGALFRLSLPARS